MAATVEQKKRFQEELKKYKEQIDGHQKEITILKSTLKKKADIANYMRIGIALQHLRIMGTYLAISDISLEIINLKNETYLNNARKEVYKVLQALEEICGNDYDLTFNESYDKVKSIRLFSSKQKLVLLKSVKHVVAEMIERFGPNTKWRWSFQELHAREAIIAKNLTDWRKVEQNNDPRDPDYYPTLDLVAFVKEELYRAAQAYKAKYDIMDNKVDDDLKKIIQQFEALIMIHNHFGEQDETKRIKALVESTKETLEAKNKKEKAPAKKAGKTKKKKKK